MTTSIRSLARYRGQQCLNCGVPLDDEDKFCHQCGQLNSIKKLALKDFLAEFFSNIFSYDSRGWRTIKHILFKPGYVSKEFIKGKRMSYANPFRFFLSVCIVFFIMIQASLLYKKYTDPLTDNVLVSNGVDGDEITDAQLEEIEQEPIAGKFIADKIREERDKQNSENELDSITTVKKKKEDPVYLTQKELDDRNWFKRIFNQIEDYQEFYNNEKITDPGTALTKLNHRLSSYNKVMYERSILINSIGDDGSKIADIIIPKLPLFLFLFTPFVTLFLWLLYARRSFNYMEHLIFLFNIMTFVFLSSIIMVLIEWITFDYVDLSKIFFLLIGPFYLYKSMRNFYGQSRLKTILKFLLINFVYSISFMIGFLLLLFIGIVFY